VSVPHSWGQLLAATRRIGTRVAQLRSEGIQLAQWGPDPISNKVKITLEAYSPRIVNELVKQFGSQWISIRKSTEKWLFTSRFTDGPPFFGGDAIWFPGQNSSEACTSGFAYTTGSTRYMTTADHCVIDAGGGYGTDVYTNTATQVTMGTVAGEYLSSKHIDVATIKGNFYPIVYGNAEYTVIGALKAEVGDLVSADGKVSGEVQKVRVESVDQNIYVSDCGCTIYFATVATKSGATVCQVGDSGGPWFEHTNSAADIYAVGSQSGERQDENGKLDPSVCVYEQMPYILDITDGAILTG
jgi:hypothetical protein